MNTTVIDISVNFTKPAPVDGSVYCSILYPSVIIESVDNIFYSSTHVNYLVNDTGVLLTYSAAIPSTNYNIYSALESYNGMRSSFTNTIATSIAVKTACCRAISFTNYPTSIYISNPRAPETTIAGFSFSIGSLNPNNDVSFTLQIQNTATLTYLTNSDFSTDPASFTFSTSSSTFSDSFSLTIYHSLSGIYSFGFFLSGEGASDYSVDTVNIPITSYIYPTSLPSSFPTSAPSSPTNVPTSHPSGPTSIPSAAPTRKFFFIIII